MRLLRLKALIALSIVQFLFVSASLSHDENTPRGVHIVASQLYQVSLDDVDDNVVAHNYNNFRNGEGEDWSEDLSGYEGGHSGYDFDHTLNSTARIYSLTNGTVIRTRISTIDPESSLSYISVYNRRDNTVISYLHLSDIDVEEDEEVYVGKYLGRQGCNDDFTLSSCNRATGTGYHLHIEVRNVDNKDDLPLTTSKGADPDLSDPATEPICYLYAELLEDAILRNAGFAAPSRIRSIAETWGNLKAGN